MMLNKLGLQSLAKWGLLTHILNSAANARIILLRKVVLRKQERLSAQEKSAQSNVENPPIEETAQNRQQQQPVDSPYDKAREPRRNYLLSKREIRDRQITKQIMVALKPKQLQNLYLKTNSLNPIHRALILCRIIHLNTMQTATPTSATKAQKQDESRFSKIFIDLATEVQHELDQLNPETMMNLAFSINKLSEDLFLILQNIPARIVEIIETEKGWELLSMDILCTFCTVLVKLDYRTESDHQKISKLLKHCVNRLRSSARILQTTQLSIIVDLTRKYKLFKDKEHVKAIADEFLRRKKHISPTSLVQVLEITINNNAIWEDFTTHAKNFNTIYRLLYALLFEKKQSLVLAPIFTLVRLHKAISLVPPSLIRKISGKTPTYYSQMIVELAFRKYISNIDGANDQEPESNSKSIDKLIRNTKSVKLKHIKSVFDIIQQASPHSKFIREYTDKSINKIIQSRQISHLDFHSRLVILNYLFTTRQKYPSPAQLNLLLAQQDVVENCVMEAQTQDVVISLMPHLSSLVDMFHLDFVSLISRCFKHLMRQSWKMNSTERLDRFCQNFSSLYYLVLKSSPANADKLLKMISRRCSSQLDYTLGMSSKQVEYFTQNKLEFEDKEDIMPNYQYQKKAYSNPHKLLLSNKASTATNLLYTYALIMNLVGKQSRFSQQTNRDFELFVASFNKSFKHFCVKELLTVDNIYKLQVLKDFLLKEFQLNLLLPNYINEYQSNHKESFKRRRKNLLANIKSQLPGQIIEQSKEIGPLNFDFVIPNKKAYLLAPSSVCPRMVKILYKDHYNFQSIRFMSFV